VILRVMTRDNYPFEQSEFQVAGKIGPGLCVLLGVTHSDTEATAIKMADKIWHLRILDDADGVMNLSPAQVAAVQESPPEIMVVSQFTLYGDTGHGAADQAGSKRPVQNRPNRSWAWWRLNWAAWGAVVATGVFRSEMQVELINDGPVTLLLEL
jgi:D-aminoacyl-tRNA deacylase